VPYRQDRDTDKYCKISTTTIQELIKIQVNQAGNIYKVKNLSVWKVFLLLLDKVVTKLLLENKNKERVFLVRRSNLEFC